MRGRTGLLAAALAIFVTGCSATAPMYHHYTRFLTHLDQADLDVLDISGPEGARLLIGILELDGQWKVVTGTAGKRIQIEAFRVVRRTVMNDQVIEAPPQIVRGPWWIANPYVIQWAEKRRASGKE